MPSATHHPFTLIGTNVVLPNEIRHRFSTLKSDRIGMIGGSLAILAEHLDLGHTRLR